MSARSFRLALSGVLLLAAALRLWGLRWGLPDATHLFSYHPDEFHSLRGILSLSQGDLNPHFFNYGSLYLYLVSAACVVAHGGLVAGLDVATLPEAIRAFTLDARIVSALAGIATVYVVGLIGTRIASRAAGLVAALALAVMPLHVLNCHYGTVDVTQALFIALCAYFSVRIVQGEGLRSFAWAGAMVGLAASVKYNGIVALVMPGVAWMVLRLTPRPRVGLTPGPSPSGRGENGKGTTELADDGVLPLARRERGPGGEALLCLLAALVAFAATSPYTLFAWSEAKKDIFFELGHMRNGEAEALAIWPNGWLFHLYISFCLLPVAFALIGKAQRRLLAPVLGFGLLWYVMISVAKVRYARYGVPLDIAAAVGIGALCAGAWDRVAKARVVAWGLCGALAASWSLLSCVRNVMLCEPLPQDTALTAVLQEVPPNERVGMVNEPWFSLPPVDYCNGGTALRGNRLWAQFKRPQRQIVVTGVDAGTILAAKPYAFVVSDAELANAAAVAPAARSAWNALTDGKAYDAPHEPIYEPWPNDSLVQAPPATDSRYASPRIWIFHRND